MRKIRPLLLVGLSVGPTSAPPTACPEPRLLRSGGAGGERSAAVACNARGSALPALHGPARLLFGRAIDLNRASAQSLEVLPRIGPSRAAAIVRARRERRFESPESLQRVEGIGPRTIAGLAGWVEVHGALTPEPQEVP